MRSLFVGLMTGLVVLLISIQALVCLLIPQMSIGQDQAVGFPRFACVRNGR